MNPPTPQGGNRPDHVDDQQTLLQLAHEKAAPPVLQTGIQAIPGGPRLDIGPIPLTRVGPFELLKEVGRGGMGVVFKARHVQLNRIVALKMIRGGALANADELQRFEKEATAAAQLQHPNIVALYDVSTNTQQPYLSMEFIGGTSLAERLSLGPLTSRRAAAYVEATARAVHYAHGRGIIHRDLKPANVLLDDADQPKITDFGLAKQMETGSDQTRTGAILGTPSYMSPEQAAGTKNIGPASDIYSLGAVLYELITGKPPFCGDTPMATLNLVADQDPLPPRVLNPTVDRDLETICLKCLEKSPARRYTSADSLADDLRRYLDGEAISARRLSLVGRGMKWIRKNPAWTALTAFCVVVIAAFMAVQVYVAYEEKELREDAERATEQAKKAERLADVRLESMRRLLYLSEMRLAQQTLKRADFDGVERILNEPRQRDLRDWEWYFLKDQCQVRLAFGSHTPRAFAVAYRGDGKQLASAGGDLNRPGEIKLWEVRSRKLLRTLQGHGNAITALAYHPEKPLLASAGHDQTIKLWDLETGVEIHTLRGHLDSIHHVAFSAKGDLLASASQDKTVRVWDYERYPRDPAASVRTFSGHDNAVTSVAFHPDGLLLASGSRDQTVKLWTLATGQVERTLVGNEGEIESLVFNTAGDTLVAGGGRGGQRGEVCSWNVNTGKLQQSRYGLSDRVLSVSMSRDGKIVAGGADGMVRVWELQTSSEPHAFRADPQLVAGVAFAPDGLSLVSAGRSGRISMWNSSAGLETLTLSTPGQMEAVAFHPQGRYVAAAGQVPGEVRAWNLDYPDHPILYKGHKSGVFSLAFSPDGHQLASGGEDRTVHLFDFRDPEKAPVVLQGHTARVNALAFHPDGAILASASGDETIRLHDPATGNLIRILTGHTNGILCLAFSADGNWLASGGFDRGIRVWDTRTGKEQQLLEGHTGSINALAFSPNGQSLASASSDKTIRLWDLKAKKEPYKLESSPGKIHSLAFHPHGRRLVSVGDDRTIRLWDIITRQEILEFEDPAGPVRQVAFSADGRHLAGAGNQVVRVWQAAREIVNERR